MAESLVAAESRRWWTKKDAEAADGISATLALLVPRQLTRVRQLVDYARLYGNLSVWGITGFNYGQLRVATQNVSPNRVTFNVCQSCVDTVGARQAQIRPKPWYQTKKGDFGLQRKAKKLNDYTSGIFYEQNAYALGAEASRDSRIWGDGFLYVGERGKDKNRRIFTERVTPSELFVDEWEGMRGRPRQMSRVFLIDRSVVRNAWPGAKDSIDNAPPAEAIASALYPSISDLIEVRQSWHLRSGPDAKDGKTCVSIPGGNKSKSALLEPMEDWDHDYFPFVRFRWSPKPIGFWSQGLVEQLEGIQLEINKLLRLCQRSHDLGGSWKMLVPVGSRIVSEHMRPDIGVEIQWAGTQKPEYVLPPHVPPEIYEEIQQKKRDAYEQSGVSRLDAVNEIPSGVKSGKAMRTMSNLSDDRMRMTEEGWQNAFCGPVPPPWGDPFPPLAHLYIETARSIAEKNHGHYAVKYPGRKFLEEMDWKDVEVSQDEYRSQCFPVSAFSDDPAEKMEDVQDLAQAGLIAQEDIAELLDYPDLAGYETLQTAQKDYISDVLNKIVDGDGGPESYTAPDPLDNLALFKTRTLQTYAAGKLQGLEDDKLAQLRRLLVQIDGLMQRAATAMAPPPGAAPGAPPGASATPQGMPAKPPVSPLLPQAA